MQPMPPGFPPNPYAPAGAPTPQATPPQQQYAQPPVPGQPGGYGVTPVQPSPAGTPVQPWAPPSQYQAAPPQGFPPQAPAYAPAPPPAQQYTGLGPSGYGAPPGPAPAPLPAPYAAPVQAQGYVPPVNWADPKIYQYQKHTPFVPWIPNQYVLHLLHFRYDKGVYYADLRCESAAYASQITDQRTGMPIMSCSPGNEYALQFDMTKTGSEVFKTEAAQRNLAFLIGAITRQPPTPELVQYYLNELVSKSRDQLTALGLRFQLTLTSRVSKNHKPVTDLTFAPVAAAQ